MREIKFRVWDGDKIISLSMAHTLQYIVIQDNDEDSKYANELSVEYEDVILMQYTGLKDKNGIEIYEYMEIDDNFEVSFKDGCYILTNISNGDIMLLYNYLRDKNGQVTATKEYTKI